MGRTAAIVVIGNEILTGKVVDANTPFLTKELWQLGVMVRRVVVVADEIDMISTEVALAATHHDLVFTSGGVGPTHDDVTMEGVARAFHRGVVGHPELLAMLREYFKTDTLTDAQARLAELPEGSRLIFAEGLKYPQVACENVYIFPGIPGLLREKFTAIRETFRELPFHLRRLRLAVNELDIAPLLNDTVSRFKAVTVGSYPQEVSSGFEVLITMESLDEGSLAQAYGYLKSRFSADAILPLEREPSAQAG